MPFDKLRANGFKLAAGRMDKTVRSEANFSVRGEPVEPLTLDRVRTDIRPSSFVLPAPDFPYPVSGHCHHTVIYPQWRDCYHRHVRILLPQPLHAAQDISPQ